MSDVATALGACVHCGFCLPACPTYAATGDEADGPRGRIVLMQALACGAVSPTDLDATAHLDRCLGCRACEPVCPSGVRYGEALETSRGTLDAARGTPLLVRATIAVMTEPLLRRLLLGLARLIRPFAGLFAGWSRAGFAAGMLAGSRPWHRAPGVADGPAVPAGPVVQLFLGCIQRELFAGVHAATEEVLAANGCTAARPAGQGCCGALHAHAGRHDEALRLARANVAAFHGSTGSIVVNAAGCGAMLRDYGRLLATDPLADAARQFAARVRDVTEVLAERGPAPGGPLAVRVAYDAPCHLEHAQRVTDPPLTVLGAIPGLEIVAHEGADRCCGGAGLYGLQQPALSHAVLRAKLRALRAADVDVVVTGNPGCQMQIAAGLLAEGYDLPVCHPVELLAASYRTRGIHSQDA